MEGQCLLPGTQGPENKDSGCYPATDEAARSGQCVVSNHSNLTRRTWPQEDQDFLELDPSVPRSREGGNGGQESSGALRAIASPMHRPTQSEIRTQALMRLGMAPSHDACWILSQNKVRGVSSSIQSKEPKVDGFLRQRTREIYKKLLRMKA